MSSTLHIDGHQKRIPSGWTWPAVILVSLALMLWAWVLKPLTWWFFRGGHLHSATDDMLRKDGIRNPNRERLHVAISGLLFIVAALCLWLSYSHWNLILLAAGAVLGAWYAGLTYVYYRNEQESLRYPPPRVRS